MTNAFVSSMWYADWLGFAAHVGVSAVLRETLVGGYYGILNHSTLMPNPDAFMMALFVRLMGPRVLSATVDPGPGNATANATTMLRVYAHCHPATTPGVTNPFQAMNDETLSHALPRASSPERTPLRRKSPLDFRRIPEKSAVHPVVTNYLRTPLVTDAIL